MCPPRVKIGLTDLPKTGGAKAPPAPLLATALASSPRVNWSLPYLEISNNEILGVFRPFIQRSLDRLCGSKNESI